MHRDRRPYQRLQQCRRPDRDHRDQQGHHLDEVHQSHHRLEHQNLDAHRPHPDVERPRHQPDEDHPDVERPRHQPDEAHPDEGFLGVEHLDEVRLDDPFPVMEQKDYFPDEKLGVEYPFPEPKRKDYCPVLEFRELEQLALEQLV
jgi:hypothetical protein